MKKMHPHPTTRSGFKYPHNGFLLLRDFVRDEELKKPTMVDVNEEACLIVLKNGVGSGLTVGRMTGLESIVRVYPQCGIESTSWEVAIHPYNKKSGPFSSAGDSGAVVSDSKGRIVGMITGGSGLMDSNDITYATPYSFLEKRIKAVFPHLRLYPNKD